MMVKTFCGGPIAANGYLVADEPGGKAIIIDCPHGTAAAMLRETRERGLDLDSIILTHAHWDHAGDCRSLRESAGVPLKVHRLASPRLEDPDSLSLGMGFEVEPCAADQTLREGDRISAGGLIFEVLHTPGHSPGSICLYERRAAALFSGDTLFDGTCGRVDLPGGSKSEMAASLRRLGRLPPETRVFPGHGPETTIGGQGWMGDILASAG